MTTLSLADMQRDIAVEIARRAPATPLDILDLARLRREHPALAEAIAEQDAKQFWSRK